MSGHSHWATIKHQKASNDAKKGQLFTKLSRVITYAAREKGGDPAFNPTLADAIKKAKSLGVSKETMDKAIKKGTGGSEGVMFEEVTYEGYGSMGEAYLVKALTDNKNRTVSELRHILNRFGGSLGTPGSAAYVFGNDPDHPSFTIPITDVSKAKTVLSLTEELDEHDDVQEVYSNFEIPEELLVE